MCMIGGVESTDKGRDIERRLGLDCMEGDPSEDARSRQCSISSSIKSSSSSSINSSSRRECRRRGLGKREGFQKMGELSDAGVEAYTQ